MSDDLPIVTALQQRSADLMSEADLQREVEGFVRALAEYGADLRSYHTHDSRRSNSGWPDLVIAGPHGVLVRELKVQSKRNGRVSRDQQWWLDMLAHGGDINVGVWRPLDWVTHDIQRQIVACAGPRFTRFAA